MNVKKSLQNRIRGWLPQEQVSKIPFHAQIVPINLSLSFKVRRWLRGFSAFITALWCQRSLRFKMQAVFFGAFAFLSVFMFFLGANNLVGSSWNDFGWFMLLVGYGALQAVIYRYSERREPRKNQPIKNMNPSLRFGSTILCVLGVAIFGYSIYLTDFVYNTFENSSTIPFYLLLLGLLVYMLGLGIFALGRKGSKYSLLQTIHSINFV